MYLLEVEGLQGIRIEPSTMKPTLKVQLVCLLVLFVATSRIAADAIVVTKAATATTIAEIFVSEREVRVELEIGQADLQVIREILLESSGSSEHNALSADDKASNYFREGFVIRVDDGPPLVGKIADAKLGRRVARDEISGDPLLNQSKDAEQVLRLSLRYPLDTKPTTISFNPPRRGETSFRAANIGFITYHNGLPVNDFRYLATEAILELDWKDPWYSHFRHPNLRRRFDAPVSVFLYVEPFEVRKEIVLRPKDLQEWVDLGLEGRETIPISDQKPLKRKITDYLARKNPVSIDGRLAEGKLDRIHFLRRSLRKTGVIDPPEELDIDSATLGVIFVYPTKRLPQRVSMTWELFNDKIRVVPGVTTDEAGGFPGQLTADDPVLVWNNMLTNPTVPAMLSVATPPESRLLRFPIISIISLIALLILVWRSAMGRSRGQSVMVGRLAIGISLVIVSLATSRLAQIPLPNPVAPQQEITSQEADSVLAALLHNIYRAFDRREESLVYDRLAQSISGDLLTDVYLQTRQSIELESQGGARVRINDVLLQSTTIDSLADQIGFSANCRWTVSGSVGHWGHLHQRQNAYEANFLVRPINGHWKITDMELLDERRLDNPTVISRR